jgi:hypothetical protein
MSDFTDPNGTRVHSFALEMSNLGLSRVAELLVAMHESDAWRHFTDGNGNYQFLPGEFDYFLTQQGVTRDHVMHGVRDIAVKARLEEAMDERRTGEQHYRRPITEIRDQLPQRPGRPIEPFGYQPSEARHLDTTKSRSRPALGRAPRQFRLSGGTTTKRPNEQLTRTERLTRTVLRLGDDDLHTLSTAIAEEQRRRATHQAGDDPTPR